MRLDQGTGPWSIRLNNLGYRKLDRKLIDPKLNKRLLLSILSAIKKISLWISS